MKKIIYIGLFFFFCEAFSQDSIVSCGANINGDSCNLSYSIGQVVFNSYSFSSGLLWEGVQQSFSDKDFSSTKTPSFQLSIYPNPTSDWLHIEVENFDFNIEKLHYQLLDINGRIVLSDNILIKNISINLVNLPSSIYFLKILNNNIQLKSTKVLKK